jgi:hypothetical protein
MAWKTSIPWFGAVATFAAGYVWVRTRRGRRAASPHGSQSAPLLSELDEITEEDLMPVELDLEELARDDALKALAPPPNGSAVEDELDDPSTWVDVDLDESGDRVMTVESAEHQRPGDEPYDAVDAEDVGTTWLRRATQAEPLEGSDPDDIWGTQVIIPELDASGREAAPPDSLEAPPTGELSPTEQDLARRAAAEAQRLRSRR